MARSRGEGILPLRVAGILPTIRGRDALDTEEQGRDALATGSDPDMLVWPMEDGVHGTPDKGENV